MSLKRPAIALLLAASFAAGAYLALGGPERGAGPGSGTPSGQGAGADAPPLVAVSLPESLSAGAQAGERLFADKCASCHGRNAAGRQGVAPPLVHIVYEPGHHGDESFQRAVALGVRAHHWPFGNMPPVEGLSRAEVARIVAYVRELQRANGIE